MNSRKFAWRYPTLRIARIVMALAVTVSIFLVGQPTSVYAACSGASCTGKDPIAQGCDGSAYTVGSTYAGSGTYQIRNDNRYSTACIANWGRVVNTSGTSRYMKEDTLGAGTAETYPLSFISGTYFYTDMIDGNYTICTLGYIDTDNNPNTGPYEITTSQYCA